MASLRSAWASLSTYTWIESCARSLCKDVMSKFVLRLEKCTELNVGLVEQMPVQYTKIGRLPSCCGVVFRINTIKKLSKFSLNLNSNVRNDAHQKLGPFLGHPVLWSKDCIAITLY